MSLYSEIDKASKYKLLELDPDLLEYLTTSEHPQLILKGPRNDSKLVLCTDTKTFKVREIQHSNSLFVMRSGANDCRLLSNVPSSWETIDITGSNDHCEDAFRNVPVYYGAMGTNLQHDVKPTAEALSKPKLERKRPETLAALKLRVPVSEAQFAKLWAGRAGVELTNGRLYTLSDDVVHDVLRDILVLVMKDIKSVDPALVYAQLAGADGGSHEEPEAVVEAVIKKFAVNSAVPFELAGERIVQWLGIYTLQSHDGEELAVDTFVDLWTAAVPVPVERLGSQLDLALLNGHFVKITPTRLTHLARSALSAHPETRFRQLLDLKPMWELTEIAPFVDDLRSRALTLERFVMKFAKKKTAGSRVYVTSR
jgi:sister chromatid cohesion protein DCC1